MVWKNQGLIDSTNPKFGDGQSDIGPVNKLTPMQGGFKSGSNTPGFFGSIKNLFTPKTKYRTVAPSSGTVGGAKDGIIDKGKMFWDRSIFGGKSKASVSEGGAGGGTTISTYAQYFGVAAVGLAVGDLAGSVYNKRKSKRKK